MDQTIQLPSLLRTQNMMVLCKQLKLPVTYKVSAQSTTNINLETDSIMKLPVCILCLQIAALRRTKEVSVPPLACCTHKAHLVVCHQVWEVSMTDEHKPEAAATSTSSSGNRHFVVVVHVLSDHAFKKYMQHCSNSDLMLFRGLLLKVSSVAPRLSIEQELSMMSLHPLLTCRLWALL